MLCSCVPGFFAETRAEANKRVAVYATAVAIGIGGLAYASVPLYQMFCQATGYGGTTQKAEEEKFKNMKPVAGAAPITVYFNADTSSAMPWTFVPQQRSIKVRHAVANQRRISWSSLHLAFHLAAAAAAAAAVQRARQANPSRLLSHTRRHPAVHARRRLCLARRRWRSTRRTIPRTSR